MRRGQAFLIFEGVLNMTLLQSSRSHPQHGVSLVMVLLLLVIVSLLGVASMQIATMAQDDLSMRAVCSTISLLWTSGVSSHP